MLPVRPPGVKRRAWQTLCGGMIALVVAAPSGCDAVPSSARSEVVRDSAGVRLIDLPASTDAATARRISLDSSWRQPADLELGELVDVDVGPEGRVFLLDRLAAKVVVLSAEGAVQGSFGRAGGGPGEFAVEGLRRLVATDSSILVPDLFGQRVTEFDFSGNVLGVRRLPVEGYALDWAGHPDGGLAYRLVERDGDVLVLWHGERVDTLLRFEPVSTPPNTVLGPVALWGVGPSRTLISARSDRGRVEARRGKQDTLRWVARLGGEVLPLRDDERAHLEEVILDFLEQADPAEVPQNALDMIQYPEHAPRLAGVMIAPEGDVWLRPAGAVLEMEGREVLRVASAEGYGGTTWIVLTGEGVLRERVELPADFRPRRFSGAWIYGIHTDELGVQRPARVGR